MGVFILGSRMLKRGEEKMDALDCGNSFVATKQLRELGEHPQRKT